MLLKVLKNDLTALVPRFEDSGHKALGGSQGPPGCAPPGCGDSRVTELAVRGAEPRAPSWVGRARARCGLLSGRGPFKILPRCRSPTDSCAQAPFPEHLFQTTPCTGDTAAMGRGREAAHLKPAFLSEKRREGRRKCEFRNGPFLTPQMDPIVFSYRIPHSNLPVC